MTNLLLKGGGGQITNLLLKGGGKITNLILKGDR